MKRIIALFLILTICVSIVGCGEDSSNKVKIPSSASDYRGENFQDVISELKAAGFTNIETEKLEDLITGWLTKDGSVKQVAVNGDSDFNAGTKFPVDSEIVITYHTFPSDNDDNTTAGEQQNNTDTVEYRTETEKWLASSEYAECVENKSFPVIPGNNPYGSGVNESDRNQNIYYLNYAQKGPWGTDSGHGDYKYYIPSGTYLVMNASNPKQYDSVAKGCNVYITTEDNEDDWETYAFTEYGETKEIIIPVGGYVSLTISAIITLEPLSE